MKKGLLGLLAFFCALSSWAQDGLTDITSTYLTKNYENQVIEVYAGWGALEKTSGEDVQEVTLPAGDYRLTGRAFYRYGQSSSTDPSISTGYMFAGENETKVATLGSIEGLSSYADNVEQARTAFYTNNYYLNTLDFSLSEESTITIGYRCTHEVIKSWFIFGEMKLYQVALDAYLADYNAAYAKVDALDLSTVSAEAKAKIEAVLAETETVNQTKADLQAATAKLDEIYAYALVEQKIFANASSVAGATAENPIATNFVVNGTFDNNTSGWKTTTGAQNQGLASNQKGAFTGNFFENWNPSAYTGKIYQEIKNIPNGVYELSICAFVSVFDASCQYVYGNDAKTYLTTGAPTAYKVVFEVTDNTAEIGFEQTVAKAEWSGIDNVSLTYYGADASISDVLFGSYIKTVAELRATAADLLTKVNEANKPALQDALDATETIGESIEEYVGAIEILTEANNAAKANADLKAAIDNYYDLMASTNVYTQEAYETFKSIADGYLAKWEANELTETVVNPYAIQGWHADVNYDDFLLSAWGTNNFDTNLYINTWSTEGGSDGSGFTVPFFEYWTNDDRTLEATTKTATITGLTPGASYKVSAWVRARLKNNAAAPTYGITLSVGADGTPVDVAAGTQVGASPFYLGEYVAMGTADAEGNLTINFNVAADNNISWLSYKNVKYTEVSTGKNLDFSESTPVDNHITTYSKDMATNGTTYCNMLPVTGWNFGVANGDAVAAGVFAYGGTPWIAGAGFLAPAINPEGVAEGNALGALACWGATVQYTQEVTLAPGNYVLTIPVYNSGAGVNVPSKSLIGFIAKDGTEYLAPAKAYTSNTWTSEVITFTLNEITDGILTLGYTSPGGGGGANQHLFFDCVKIEAVSNVALVKAELASAIASAQATVEAKANVGDGLFMIPTAALDTYAAAVATAQAVYDNAEATADDVTAAIEALAAATATYVATPATAPAADKTYQIMHEAAGTFLALNGGVKVEAEASPLSFVAAGDGKYYIANANGEYAYYSGTGNNIWSLGVSVDSKEAWTIAAVGNGAYTIKGKNGHLGTDAATAGSTCFGDKAATNWVITEYVEPVAEFEVTMVNPAGATAEKIAEGESVEFTTNWDDKVGFMLMTVEQIDPATSEVVDAVTSFGTPTKGETSWKAEAYFDVKFREGFNYKFTFYAYENEDAYAQEPWEAPYSAAIATDEVEIAGALAGYVYSTATLNDITPAFDAVIESETDNVVTLTFSAPVKVQDAQTVVREGGFMAPPTVYTYTPVAVDADENGFATTWTFEMKLFPGSTNVTFAAVDAEGRRVQGNMGEEETSYFSYEWTCTVGIPDITIAPAGFVAAPVNTLTVTCAEQIDPYMGGGVVLNAAGVEVATIANMEKVVDDNLEMFTPEWSEAMATAPVTITLSNAITEPGTYTVKLDAGLFMINNGAYMSKATEAKFTVVAAENLVEVDVERIVNYGYAADVVNVDLAAICAKLGIETIAEATVWGVNATTLEFVADAMTKYDGWRNAEGDFTTWGSNHQVCYKYFATGAFELCTEPNNEPAAGTEYTAYWAFSTESDTVVLKTNILFVEAPEVEVEIVKTITVNHYEKPNTAYSATTNTFDVAAVTEALGIENIAEAEQFIMNVTDGSLVLNTTDGWRDANGDAAGWGSGEKMVCVKIQNPASGTIDYVGCIDANWNEGETFVAKWAFVYNGKAVVVEVVIEFNANAAVGINGISADDVVETEYFSINGAALNTPVKGINVVKMTLKNGKVVTSKVYVK